MTIDQKVEAYRMRLEGATLQSIAVKFGVSKERIRQIVPPIDGKTWKFEDMQNRCVYPGIGQWLYEHRCTYTKLANLAGVPMATVSRWMNGVHKPNKDAIDKILKATGLTYEQAFGEELDSRPDEVVGDEE